MKLVLFLLAAVVAILLCGMLLFLTYGREKSWSLLVGSPDRGQLEIQSFKRSQTDNDALACTSGIRTDCDITLPAFEDRPEILIERLAQRIERVDPLARRVDDATSPRQLRYVTYSPIMRFPDLINIEAILRDDGRSGLLAYARAQLGKRDMGANKARLTLYLEDL